MDSINILELMKQEMGDKNIVSESRITGRIPHLYSEGKMTFGEIRNILYDVFKGKTILKEKCDGKNLLVTYKDGKFVFARNKQTLKEPLDIEKLGKCFDGNPILKEAFVNSANSFVKALNTIEAKDLERLFLNGQRYANIDIVYPPSKNILDYGNRCFIQINGVDVFDEKMNKISEDEEASKWIYEKLKVNEALKQEMFEITEPNILRMKNSVSADKALGMIMEEFDNLIDGYSLKTSIQDFANDRLKRYIINVCNHNNISVDRNCDFVNELADRLNYFSHKRPTKSDICTYAKKAGIYVHGDDYKKVMETLESQKEVMNEEIMRPVERLIMNAGSLLLKNLSGFMSADPQKTSQKLVTELEETISEIEKDNSKLTSDKLKIFRKNMKKIDEWQEKYMPSEGCIVKIPNKNGGSRCYKIIGAFGAVTQILNLMR